MDEENEHLVALAEKLRQDLSPLAVLAKRLLGNCQNTLEKQEIALAEIIRLLSENPAIITPAAQDLLKKTIQMNEDTAEQLTAEQLTAELAGSMAHQLAAELRDELAAAEFASLGGRLGTEADISTVNTEPTAEHEGSTVEQYAVDVPEAATAAAKVTAAELAVQIAPIDFGTTMTSGNPQLGRPIAENDDTEEQEITEATGKKVIEEIVQDKTQGSVITSTVPTSILQSFNLRSDIYNIPERVPQHLNPNYPTSDEWIQLQDEFDAAEEAEELTVAARKKTGILEVNDSDSEDSTEEQTGYDKEESVEL